MGWNKQKDYKRKIPRKTYDHSRKVEIVGQTKDYAKYTFLNRSCVNWNMLPQSTVSATSTSKFKKLL
jgi:hypothetical protein